MKRKRLYLFLISLLLLTSLYVGLYLWYQSERNIPVTKSISTTDKTINAGSIDKFMVTNLNKTGVPGVTVSITKVIG